MKLMVLSFKTASNYHLLPSLLLALLLAALFTPNAYGAPGPKKNWTISASATDASGSDAQNAAPYYDYDQDLYENIDYTLDNAANSDLEVIGVGFDKDFFYIDFEMASQWSSSSQISTLGVELNIDQSRRGDWLLTLNMQSEFDDKEKWVDAEKHASYGLYEDANNDVGGSDPLAPDGNPGDGYESRKSEKKDKVFGRVMNDGRFQIAIKRDEIDAKDQDFVGIRAWAGQFGHQIAASNFTLHDHLAPMDIHYIDSYPGTDTSTWLPIIDVDQNAIDLSVTQSVDEEYRREGDTVIVTTTVEHIFGTHHGHDIKIKYELPDGLSLVSVDAGDGEWDQGKEEWYPPDLNPSDSSTLIVTATVDVGQIGNTIESFATLTDLAHEDINESNNVGESTIYITGTDGTVEFVADLSGGPLSAVLPGDDLFAMVVDLDLNRDSTAIENDEVVMNSLKTGDSIVVSVIETSVDSAMFTGVGRTSVSSIAIPSDDVLQITSDDTVTVRYLDRHTSTGEENIFRTDELTFNASIPVITLIKNVDKSSAPPGATLTYQVDFNNSGNGQANALNIETLIPAYTNYIPDSMRIGSIDGSYESAVVLTDANDGKDGELNGSDVAGYISDDYIHITIDQVQPNDGTPGTGADSGKAYFLVLIQ